MKDVKHFVVIVSSVVLIIGCKSTPILTKQADLIPKAQLVACPSADIVCESEHFQLKKTPSVSIEGNCITLLAINDKASVSELGAFGACAYRMLIKPKLSKGVALSIEEQALLEFCVESQIASVSTYADIFLADMQGLGPVFKSQTTGVQDVHKKAMTSSVLRATEVMKWQTNFANGNSPLRNAMREWGRYCYEYEPAYAVSACNMLWPKYSLIDADMQRRIREVTGVSFLPNTHMSSKAIGGGARAPVKDGLLTADEWHNLAKNLDRCILEFREIDKDVQMAHMLTTDASWKSVLDDYSIRSGLVIADATRKYRYSFYDVPFLFFCTKAYSDLKAQKHWWNDNEIGMENVLLDFYEKIDGSRMILHIASQEAATAQAKLITFSKDEMGSRFDQLQTSTRLYRVYLNEDDPFGDNRLE